MTDYLEALWADHAPSDPDDPTWCRYCRDWGCQIRPLVAALRAAEALCDAGDEAAANATRAYPEGEPDPGPPPAWVWADDIRTAIRDALEAR